VLVSDFVSKPHLDPYWEVAGLIVGSNFAFPKIYGLYLEGMTATENF